MTTINVYAEFFDLDDNRTGREVEHTSDVDEWDRVADEIGALCSRYDLVEKTMYQWRSDFVYGEGRKCRVVLEVDVGNGLGLIPVGIFGSVKAG